MIKIPSRWNPLFLAFLIPAIYWIYLWHSTSIVLIHDSVGYEELGRLLYRQGWIEYFKTGPNREPIYPFLISMAMRTADAIGVSYQQVLKIFQIAILFFTQLLSYTVLKKAKVRPAIITLSLLYLGISPAILNATLSLYSEIATYPFILGIVLVSLASWETLQKELPPPSILRTSLLGILFGLFFVLITLIKGIYEYIMFLFILPYLWLAIRAWIRDKKRQAVQCVLFLLIALFFCQASLEVYKQMNKIHNGVYALTNRGTFALYGSAARRTKRLTPKRLLTALAYIPGEGFCNMVFGEQECFFWGIETLDKFGYDKLHEVRQSVPKDQVDRVMLEETKKKVLENPLQFVGLMAVDGLKMFFWESTKIGFVVYPGWLQSLYDSVPFKNGIRLIISLLSLLSFIYLSFLTLRDRRRLHAQGDDNAAVQISLFILLVCTLHVGMYSLFDTIPRFALPIAPLYILIIGLSADRIIKSRNDR